MIAPKSTDKAQTMKVGNIHRFTLLHAIWSSGLKNQGKIQIKPITVPKIPEATVATTIQYSKGENSLIFNGVITREGIIIAKTVANFKAKPKIDK